MKHKLAAALLCCLCLCLGGCPGDNAPPAPGAGPADPAKVPEATPTAVLVFAGAAAAAALRSRKARR